VDHVAINVGDVPAAITFYTETIGLVQNHTRPDFGFPGAWLDTANGQQVHLIEAGVPNNLGQHFALAFEDLGAAVAAGHPVEGDYRPSFVDGSGSRRVLDSMWPLVEPLVDGALSIPVAEVADAVRTLAERVRVIAEGAGALAPAAALSGRAGTGKVVCVISGGNINLSKLAEILGGADG